MDTDFTDIDVVSELKRLSIGNKYSEITDLLRENFYQFNKEPTKLIAILTIRIYYNLHLKNFNDIDSDFELIESIFKNKLNHKFPYTRGSRCPFSTFLIYAYYPHLRGMSILSLERLHKLLNQVTRELNDKVEDYICKNKQENIYKGHENSVNKIIITVLLISDVLLSLLRPMEAIKILTTVNLKYDPSNISTNVVLSLIYRKLGYLEDSERHMKTFRDDENENYYKGILKIIEKDYEGAVEKFQTVKYLEAIQRSKKPLKDHERVFINNLAVATLYAKKSQEAKRIFFQHKLDKEGLQAHRGISSNADVLKELSIYD
ncbi:conserved hypothetical protein [Theileria orientalis strain Shintoku]|uniref:Uncharacterized protein n=1 Tax=Theileria orientalis strain Shintoku TaxID=869250 RepID=J7MEL5_THEOR|nr:conserved hypothetical protein [Theileria orientalis strain Shintoku]BAM38634.1 conserved hypothetical protein [Theileria orientalis strain Shintoku]|eukprot:XP_009688935.1 conserved hypothetical protein [Theileria orientalis strain Shintoku]